MSDLVRRLRGLVEHWPSSFDEEEVVSFISNAHDLMEEAATRVETLEFEAPLAGRGLNGDVERLSFADWRQTAPDETFEMAGGFGYIDQLAEGFFERAKELGGGGVVVYSDMEVFWLVEGYVRLRREGNPQPVPIPTAPTFDPPSQPQPGVPTINLLEGR